MLKSRVIPVVLMRDGICVQSKGFKRYQSLGNPHSIVERLSGWASDELIYLDITRKTSYAPGRLDTNFQGRDNLVAVVEDVADRAFMPLTAGGGVTSKERVFELLGAGADKVSINSHGFRRPEFISACAEEFGSQCIIASVDVAAAGGVRRVVIDGGRHETERDPIDWCREVADRGAGEILLNSTTRDGLKQGYDLELLEEVCDAVATPVIALGGVGAWEHLAQGLEAGASAVAAANIFHHMENSVYRAKRFLYDAGYNVRAPELIDAAWMSQLGL